MTTFFLFTRIGPMAVVFENPQVNYLSQVLGIKELLLPNCAEVNLSPAEWRLFAGNTRPFIVLSLIHEAGQSLQSNPQKELFAKMLSAMGCQGMPLLIEGECRPDLAGLTEHLKDQPFSFGLVFCPEENLLPEVF